MAENTSNFIVSQDGTLLERNNFTRRGKKNKWGYTKDYYENLEKLKQRLGGSNGLQK